MAALIGPSLIALQVRDLEAARRFYTDIMGLEPAPVSPLGVVVYQTEPIPFAIRTPLVDLNASTHLGWGVSLWLRCDDANALHAQLLAAGATILQPPSNGPFGRMFSLRDPEGYSLTVHNGA